MAQSSRYADAFGAMLIVFGLAILLFGFGVVEGTMNTNSRWADYRVCIEEADIEFCDKLYNTPERVDNG